MPTIEIVSINCSTIPKFPIFKSFAIIAEDKLISHRSLFYNKLKRYQGSIVHLGNKEFENEKDGGWWASDLVNWDFCKLYPSKFKYKVLPELKNLMEILLNSSPRGHGYFLTDLQHSNKRKMIQVNGINKLLDIHQKDGLRWNTIYSIYK